MIAHAREKGVRHSNLKLPYEGWNRGYKENKNFGTKPSYSPALPFLYTAKKEQTRRFQGESFFISWKLGYLQGDTKHTWPWLPPFLGDAGWNWAELVPQGWHTLGCSLCCRTPQTLSGTSWIQSSWVVVPSPSRSTHFPSFSCKTTQCTFSKHVPTIKF